MRFLLLCATILTFTALSGQSLYDLSTIQEIEIEFDANNWDQLLDNEYATTGGYILAKTVAINGVEFDSVGVKYKGNSTYNPNQAKNPFHIELDTYKDHIYEQYTDIKLSNVAKDPSFLREVLSYQVLRQYMDAPLSNFANVYVNGELIGLYSNSESISKKFVNDRFLSKDNTFVKCNPPGGAGPGSNDYPNLVYLGQDSTDYYDAYEIKSDHGWQALIDLCDTLANHIEDIESIIDVDRALWMLAYNNVLVNLDSYSGGFTQNYYLYRDDFGRFLPIIWDLNESFGRFAMSGAGNLNGTTAKQTMDHLLHVSDADFPLISQLLSIPRYRRMYIAHMKTMVLENFENGTYFTAGMEMQEIINDAVIADNNKFYSYNNFISNLASDINGGGGPGGGGGGGSVPGIGRLMDGRADYLLGLADFTAVSPTITEVAVSSDAPVVGQSVLLTAVVTDATDVTLGVRSSNGGPFEKILMNDQGLQGDVSAGDGVYSAEISGLDFVTEYYIYADNQNAGTFAPARAQHEFYEISATLTNGEVGDIVINELLASNDISGSDQDGEFDDWIELYNNGSTTIDLSGFFISDNEDNPSKWEIPSGTSIDAGGYLMIWADEDEEQEGLHANFKLSSGGEVLLLSDRDTVLVDGISFEAQTTDVSFGRYPNGVGDFRSMDPTFGAENVQTVSVEDIFAEGQISISPNPAQDYISLSSDQKITEVRIVDATGRLLIVQRSDAFSVSLPIPSQMLNGIYTVIAQFSDGARAVDKVVLSR